MLWLSGTDSPSRPAFLVQLPGQAEDAIVHAPVGQNFKVNLGQDQNNCQPLAAPTSPGMEPPRARIPPATIEGAQEFNATIGGESRNCFPLRGIGM
jgi:hypothetical protein